VHLLLNFIFPRLLLRIISAAPSSSPPFALGFSQSLGYKSIPEALATVFFWFLFSPLFGEYEKNHPGRISV